MKRVLASLALMTICASLTASDWPAWRGPTGQGHSDERNLPLKWGGKNQENVKWKVALKDPGNSTPVVWGDHIFVTQANKGGSERSLICFARADGKIRWIGCRSKLEWSKTLSIVWLEPASSTTAAGERGE